jgi:ribosomal protein S18 acetylase RimI-like enzyme
LVGFVSLLEVLPEYQGQGIGSAMAARLLERLGDLYMVDVVCDEELVDFYARFGMTRGIAMSLRRPGSHGKQWRAA